MWAARTSATGRAGPLREKQGQPLGPELQQGPPHPGTLREHESSSTRAHRRLVDIQVCSRQERSQNVNRARPCGLEKRVALIHGNLRRPPTRRHPSHSLAEAIALAQAIAGRRPEATGMAMPSLTLVPGTRTLALTSQSGSAMIARTDARSASRTAETSSMAASARAQQRLSGSRRQSPPAPPAFSRALRLGPLDRAARAAQSSTAQGAAPRWRRSCPGICADAWPGLRRAALPRHWERGQRQPRTRPTERSEACLAL